MMEHIYIPRVALKPGYIHANHEQYLKEWREAAIQRADDGDIAASICLQATFIDLVLFGKCRHDWLGIMDKYLMDGGIPIAYSDKFGSRLHKFGGQFKQSTIQAIHTRWWLENLVTNGKINHDKYAKLVFSKKQTDGLIYDNDVSETILRHRMKTELTMSMAMSVEILKAAGKLTGSIPIELATNIVSPAKCPALGYMSMEYFRLRALQMLNHEALFPIGIEVFIEACAKDLPVGWCDFSMKSKIDAYMGTAKRTERDKPIHSPLIACYVASLIDKGQDLSKKAIFENRLSDYRLFLEKNPMDIPAFQMRDIPIRFGVDKTPIEIICASFLIEQSKNK